MISIGAQVIAVNHGQTQLVKIYQGTAELWPGSPINSTGFLKYDLYNMKQEFPSSDAGDINAAYKKTIAYKSNNFSTQFLGPDTGINPWVKDYDDYQNYNINNIAQEFNSFSITGIYDQDLEYNINNITQEFISYDTPGDINAVFDFTSSYNSNNFSTQFLGPDTGINPWVKDYDEWMGYKLNNISQKFTNQVIEGIYDQDIDYNTSNITQEFISYNTPGDINAPFDYTNFYNSNNFSTQFLGPDTGINPWVKDYDEWMGYKYSNISQEFNSFVASGILDQNLLYDTSNITQEFIDYSTPGNPSAVFDFTSSYNSNNFSTQFLGPDTGINPWVKDYIEFQKYYLDNIKTSFVGPGSTGLFDSNLVYSFSNIADKFQ